MSYVICRCEDVTEQEISACVDAGATTAQEVKFQTRAGMGFCQGRVCRVSVEEAIESAGVAIELGASSLTVRLPVRPTALADLADHRGED
jgi:NAD(P)H-nitrite reductase large subunit